MGAGVGAIVIAGLIILGSANKHDKATTAIPEAASTPVEASAPLISTTPNAQVLEGDSKNADGASVVEAAAQPSTHPDAPGEAPTGAESQQESDSSAEMAGQPGVLPPEPAPSEQAQASIHRSEHH